MPQLLSKKVIATRELVLLDELKQPLRTVFLRLYEPSRICNDWSVEYEIEGLDEHHGLRRRQAIQVDAIGAIAQALETLAVEIRVTEAHKSGRLYWLEPGDDYGLVIPKNLVGR